MSIGNAFNNAQSGLAANARLAQTVASNVANAMTPGYVRRSTELTTLATAGSGSGVWIQGTVRAESPQLTAERRLAAATSAAASTIGSAYERIAKALGQPGEAGSLASRATQFETALLAAAASPDSLVALGHAVEAAKGLVQGIGAAADAAAKVRSDADAEIANQVEQLNKGLADVEELNRRIRLGIQQGRDVAALEDERGRAIDAISGIVPLRSVKREGGEIALFTRDGASLLDGRAWPLRFAPTGTVTAEHGALGTLQQHRGGVDWVEVSTEQGRGLFAGGSLGALFEVRDQVAPAVLRDLDAYARDLVARFAELDAPVTHDSAGLFLEFGEGERGAALRIAVNPRVDPSHEDGRVWRLRDGLGAEEPGPVGNAAVLQRLVDTFDAPRRPELAATTASLGAASLAAEIASFYGTAAARAEEGRSFATTQLATLAETEMGVLGVDTDAELQLLMLIEQAYAANARVLNVLDQLLKQLLEI